MNYSGARAQRLRRNSSLRPLFLVLLAAAAGSAVAQDRAHVDYMLHCQGCHLADGSGTPGSVPALNGYLGNFLHVEGGREFIVRVPGVATSALSDERLAAVMNWVLENFSAGQLPDRFQRYTAEEIGRLRRDVILDPHDDRARLVEAIERSGDRSR